jgi:hypothetical protein
MVRPWDYERFIRSGEVLRLNAKTYHEGTSQQSHPIEIATAVLDLSQGKPRLTVEEPMPDDSEPMP